ncbi:lamin tail domain-containing protein [Verrucomicrobiota bacterium sgz303538]
MRLFCFLLPAVCWLLVLSLFPSRAPGAVAINEFLASNDGGLKDEDRDESGWIELYNNGSTAVNMSSWHLTDDALNLTKWTFPAVSIAPGGYLIVFTSGKDRAAAGKPLHTNFKLDPDGEYLALVRPDNSLASVYSPAFPKQRQNVSFAQVGESVASNLVTAASSVRYTVPNSSALGTAWTQREFDDSAWASGVNGLGYDAIGGSGAPLLRIDFNDRDNNTAVLTEAGFQGFIIGNAGGNAAVQTGPITRTFGSTSVTLTDTAGTAYDDRTRTTPTTSGTFTEQLLLQDFVFSRESAGNQGLDITVAGLSPNLPVSVRVWSFDSGSTGSRVSDWSCNGALVKDNYTFNGSTLPSTNEQYRFDFDAVTTASGQLVIQGRRDNASAGFGVFLNALQIAPVSFMSSIGTDVGTGMRNVNASIYSRIGFTVADASAIQTLRLRVKYDDGFIAYVNGQVIASRNAPAVPAWNSVATADRSRSDALAYEEFNVQVPPGLLVSGQNVLAIQGLNSSAGDPDFLLLPVMDGLGQAAPAPRYFATPTPGAANAQGYNGYVADTKFSVSRGFYTAPFQVAITCVTPGSQIRYTTDGSAPSATTGIVYTGPVSVGTTTVLRAAAFVPNWIPSNVDTQSYLFKAAVAQQPANPAGWPATWGTDSEVNSNDGAGTGTVVSDYEMDPNVVNKTLPGYGVVDALGTLPTLSIVLPQADFLGPNGIYQNPLSSDAPNANPPLWERGCSIEMINADGSTAFHENCGLEIHGNSSRRPYRLQKHSFDLKFKAIYGAGKLKEKVFSDTTLAKFNTLVLRGCFTDAWALVSWDPARYRPDDSVYFRDVWVKRSFRDMGYVQSTSRFSHVYINGLYWGVYDISEDLDDDFFADHLGGLPEEWDVMGDFAEVKAGTSAAWDALFAIANAGVSTPQAYANLQQYVDVVNFIDYYLLHVHADAEDWPQHNWYAARNRVRAGGKFRFYVWDQEIALDNHSLRRIEATDPNSNADKTPGRLLQMLRANAEFRLLFADRAHKHLHNDGALSLEECQARWDGLKATLDKAIVAESARWGDVADDTPYGNTPSKTVYTREADWLPTVDFVRNTYLPSLYNSANSYATINELRAARLYPNTEPPVFGQHGGIVAPGFMLTMSATGGSIYYTLDGSDPRQAITGDIAGNTYAGPVALTKTCTVKARVRNGTEWSALTEAFFIVGVPASSANLVVSEIYYAPAVTQDHEFIELMNTSVTQTIELSGVHFTAGVSFSFPPGFTLGPGQRIVVVKNQAAFTARFGAGVQIAGEYIGSLDNSGEEIALADATGVEIFRFRYNNRDPWPTTAATADRSLVLLAPKGHPDPGLAENWRASMGGGGTPGTSDGVAFTGDPSTDADHDGINALLEYVFGTSDAVESSQANPTIAFQNLDADAGPQPFLTLSFKRATGADDAAVMVQFSTDLVTWQPALFVSRSSGGVETWRAPVPNTEQQYLRLRAHLP